MKQHRTRSVRMVLAVTLFASACGVKQHPHDDASRPITEGSGGSPGVLGTGGAEPAPGTGGIAGNGTVGSGGTSGSGGRPADGAVTPPRDGGNAPPAAAGPTINGMTVPREKAVVFIHIGHSDMAGRADSPAALRAFMTDTDPKLWVYVKGGSFRPAKEPTAGDAASAGKGGPGMALLKTALGQAPDVTFISIGHGHSGASGGYCPTFRKGQAIWPLFMDAAKELKGKVTFGGLFTMFGITEYHTGAAGLRTTHECIMGLANEVRAELDAPDMPLLVGDWNMGGSGIYSPTGEYGTIVRPLLAMIPAQDKKAALIPTDGLPMQDDRHLNFQGHKTWAERAIKIMADKAWMPWKQ